MEKYVRRIARFALIVFWVLVSGVPAYSVRPVHAENLVQESVRPNSQDSREGQLPTRLVVRTQARGMSARSGSPQVKTLEQGMGVAPSVVSHFVRNQGEFQIFDFNKALDAAEYSAVIQSLARMDGVVSVEEDLVVQTQDVPNDPYYGSGAQYYLQKDGPGTFGINAEGAWGITTGSTDIRVAVLDTGITDHTDLNGRWEGGYDFVSVPSLSGDGDGWDADPHDSSYLTAYKSGAWHGSHVTGTIGASTNNDSGIAGLNWNSPIIPVRVLGWGGGYLTDAMSGLEWAAGLPVAGTPPNPYPARVFNMSFGAKYNAACPAWMQVSIDKVYNAGGIIVAAAGNSHSDVSAFIPANCNHVIAVAAAKTMPSLDIDSSYSNYGSQIVITAPGTGIVSTTYNGASGFGTSVITGMSGTSMASPHVTGVVSLMLSARPELTFEQVVSLLKSSARAFPAGSWCAANPGACGGGFLDAYRAVLAAKNFVDPTPEPSLPQILDIEPAAANRKADVELVVYGNNLGYESSPDVSLVRISSGDAIDLGEAAFDSDNHAIVVTIPKETAPAGAYQVEVHFNSMTVISPINFASTDPVAFLPLIMR
jgi:subtilisin family serine protease